MPQAGVSVAPEEFGRYESWDEVAAEAFNFPRRGVSAGERRVTASERRMTAGARGVRDGPRRASAGANGTRSSSALPQRATGPQQRNGATDHTPAPVAAAVSRPTSDQRSGEGLAVRRTVTIRGYGAERNLVQVQSRRRSTRPYERSGFKPDRAALWAVVLGVLLVLVAASSSRGAVREHARAVSHTPAALVVVRAH